MKNELRALIIILLVIAPLVSALSIDVLKENTIAYYVNSNPSTIGGQLYQSSWYLFPRSSQTEILLDVNAVENSYTANWDNSVYNVDKSQIFVLEDIAYAFVYDAVNQKYVQVMGSGATQEGLAILGDKDVSKYPAIWILPKENVNKKLFLRVDKEIMPSVNEFTIKSGWNYFFSVPDILGKEVSEWQGNCEIIKFASWNDETLTWEDISISEFNELFSDAQINLNYLAQTLAVKVSQDCSFGVETSPPVPPLPN